MANPYPFPRPKIISTESTHIGRKAHAEGTDVEVKKTFKATLLTQESIEGSGF